MNRERLNENFDAEVFKKDLIQRHPLLASSLDEITSAFELLTQCFEAGGKLLICGNGGSAADAEHMVGELMKGFSKKRTLAEPVRSRLISVSDEFGTNLADKLQTALPAIALTCQSSLITAISNDMDPDLIFAQQVIGYGMPGDILFALSTSGTSLNVLNAIVTAKAAGLKTIGMTGRDGGKFNQYCDLVIHVNATATHEVQELHVPVYHALCGMLEEYFF